MAERPATDDFPDVHETLIKRLRDAAGQSLAGKEQSGAFLPRDDPDWGWEFLLEDFARVRILDDEASGKLTPAAAVALLHVVSTHSIYVDAEQNWGRCFTCSPAHGIPCETLRSLAGAWADHPDHPYTGTGTPSVSDYRHFPSYFTDVRTEGTWRVLQERRNDRRGH